MFGRKADIGRLIKRSRSKGLTAVVGRPQMGKTWLLEQVGGLLGKEHKCIVGYHESKGESDDHLLRTVLDLYKRWLSSASMKRQLKSIFTRHKDELISGVGRIFGTLFKELLPAGGGIIDETFKGLAAVDKDLKTGGIELPTLDYDKCLSLLQIVSQETKEKPIVLILDAWEKSPTIEKVYNTLSAFLKRLNDWPNCHIVLGIRDPELHAGKQSQQSFKLAQDIVGASAKAKLIRLASMNLTVTAEKQRMLKHVREIAQGTQKLDDDKLIRLIDGFPGVIDRFRDPEEPGQTKDVKGIYKLVKDAQKYRYRELEILLPSLEGESLTMAIRLALFQRLDESSWVQFREVLCDGLKPTAWESLRQKRIFETKPFPTYGHDTRYNDAFRRLKEYYPESIKGELENLIFSLVKRIKSIDDKDWYFVDALSELKDKAQVLELSEFHKTLCEVAEMFFLPEAQPYPDLDKALAMIPETCPEAAYMVCATLLDRGVTKGQLGDSKGEIADYTVVIEMEDAPVEQVAQALNNRGVTKGQLGDIKGAIADYTAVIEMEDAPVEQIAKVLYNRGVAKGELGDSKGEIADYTAVI